MNYLTFNAQGNIKNIVKPVVSSTGLTVLNQQSAHCSRTEDYALIKTEDVIKIFESFGFVASLVKQEKSRKETYKGFGTHLLAFSKPESSFDDLDLRSELRPVILFQNSYHGRKPATLEYALFRLVCSNGLHVSLSLSEKIVLRHKGDARKQIEKAILQMKDAFNCGIADAVTKMKTRILTGEEKQKFAEAALGVRFSKHENFISGEAHKLLTTHREEDQGDSLWLVYQRIQENLGLNYRGTPVELSYVYRAEDKENHEIVNKERKMVAVSGIGEVERINRFLFEHALGMTSNVAALS